MICRECGATCGPNARLVICPTCEDTIRKLWRDNLITANLSTAEQRVHRILTLQKQLDAVRQECDAAWKRCEVRRQNSLRYIRMVRDLRLVVKSLSGALKGAKHDLEDMKDRRSVWRERALGLAKNLEETRAAAEAKVQRMRMREPLVVNLDSYFIDLLDQARNHVTDPELRRKITEVCPPRARSADSK